MLSGEQTGAQMDDTTKREIEQLKARQTRLEKLLEIHEIYLEKIGNEMSFGAGHFAKGTELVKELRAELKKIN